MDRLLIGLAGQLPRGARSSRDAGALTNFVTCYRRPRDKLQGFARLTRE